jgi:hypothetical protein
MKWIDQNGWGDARRRWSDPKRRRSDPNWRGDARRWSESYGGRLSSGRKYKGR